MVLTVEELRKLKKTSHYSYREIAEKSGVPIGTVQKVLGGITTSPRHDTLEALTKVLLYEDKDVDGTSVSYKAMIDRELTRNEIKAVHETEYMYDGLGLQLDDMVEKLLTSKKAGEFTVEDYYLISEKYRIELIDGVIYDMAAPKLDHQHIAGLIYTQMMNFRIENHEKCLPGMAPIDVQLDRDDKTMVQPDVIVICKKMVKDGKLVYGAPDFVLEVLSPATRFKDSVIKREKYRVAGCREYWMVDPLNQRVTVLDFENNMDGVYTFDQKIPVRISGGRCQIDFSMIKEGLEDIKQIGLI